MIKERKAVKAALSLIAVGTVLLVIGYLFGGFKAIYGNSSGINIYDSKNTITERNSLDAFQNIKINVEKANVEIESGDKFEIETMYNKSLTDVSYNVSNDTLNITASSKNHISFNIGFFDNNMSINENTKIKIYIPNESMLSELESQVDYGDMKLLNLNFKKSDILCNFGDIELKNINCTNMNINDESGDITFDNVTGSEMITTSEYGNIEASNLNTENFTCDLKSGDLNLNNLKTDNGIISNEYGDIEGTAITSNGLIITSSCGEIDINGELKGKNTIDSKFGDTKIMTSLLESDYSYDFKVKFGECSVNGNSREGGCEKIESTADNIINAVCESGDLKINFGK